MKPKIKATCSKLQLQLLSFCLLCLSGKTRCDGNGPAVVTVKQDSDAVLPCSLSTKENIESYLFDWKKSAQKDEKKGVFYYNAGITYDSGRSGQSEEFKGRVSHFPEELKHGGASIIIRNTMVTDSGNYTCDFPDLQPRQSFHIELVVEPVVVKVKKDQDALLPCSRSTKENIEQEYFDWNKVAQNNEKQKEVFQYLDGRHSNTGYGSQDTGFKGRVFHFQEELKHGNASIIIRNTTMDDNGNYTCTFPDRQTFYIELVVECVLKDRTDENIGGTCPKPNLRILGPTKDGMLLRCEVQGASPKPQVELKDSSRKILAEEVVTERGGLYDIILQTTVTKTDNYSCVSTQEEICHQISASTYVPVNGAASKPNIRTLDYTDNRALLQCEANGNPQPEVEWRDSAGNILPAEEPQVSERGGRFFVTLNTTVTKTGNYRCVATQKNISHQIHAETFVHISGPAVMEQGSDAVLPCSLSTKENIESYRFDWKKAAQKDGRQKVFYYDAGVTYDSGRSGQSEEFKGRVSCFPEELKHGNASIIIRSTKVTDSGYYTCDFPDLQPRQTFHIELVVEPVVVKVKQDGDALLPCSLSTKENIEQGYFTWDKVAQNNGKEKEVFLYDKGKHSNNGSVSQDTRFKDRVSHFQEELKHGNASIIIRNTKMADNGDYTCTFTEPRQTFHIKLVVEPVLKDRTNENIPGAVSKPNIRTLDETDNWALLQCEVHGNPEPEVEWRDSAGKTLPAQKSLVTERDGFFITLSTTVTKTDHYRCVATQKNIGHQISTETFVRINGAASKPNIRTLDYTDNRALLQCEVHGNPQPEVEWRDSAGNTVPAEEPQVSERGGRFYVTLNTAVTKTGNYRCVATQKTISHQIYAETFVHISDSTPGWVIAVVSVLCTLLVVGVVVALVFWCYQKKKSNKGSQVPQEECSLK